MDKNQCDHDRCETPFCPICGCRFHPLSSLLAHCQWRLDQIQNQNRHRPDKCRKAEEKWARWVSVLKDTISETKEHEHAKPE